MYIIITFVSYYYYLIIIFPARAKGSRQGGHDPILVLNKPNIIIIYVCVCK